LQESLQEGLQEESLQERSIQEERAWEGSLQEESMQDESMHEEREWKGSTGATEDGWGAAAEGGGFSVRRRDFCGRE
jgi:hypothetical protein